MTRTADAVVVGAGVIGAAIALELARAGRSVVVVDKAGGIGHGSTSASSAIVRFHYSTRTAVALAWEARHCWQDWRGHLAHDDPDGLAAFVRTGMLVLERGPGGVGRDHRSLRRRRGAVGALVGRRGPASGRPCSTSVRTGHRSRSRRMSSSPPRGASSAERGRRTPGTSTTPSWPRTTWLRQRVATGRCSSSATRSPGSSPQARGAGGSTLGTATGRTRSTATWWSTPRVPGPAPSTRWRVRAPTSR